MAGERQLPGLGLYAFWTLGSNGYKDQLDSNLRVLSALVQSRIMSFEAGLPGSPTNGDRHVLTSGGDAGKIAIRDNGAWVLLTPAEGYLLYCEANGKFYVYDGAAWGELDASPRLPSLAGSPDALKVLRANAGGTAFELVTIGLLPAIGTGDALKLVRVNAAETGYELFTNPAPPFSLSTKTANYSTVSADFAGNKLIRMNVATANTLTVDPSMANGEPLAITQAGAGQTTIAAGAGVTINSAGGALKLRAQHSTATLMKTAVDTYLLVGDITT